MLGAQDRLCGREEPATENGLGKTGTRSHWPAGEAATAASRLQNIRGNPRKDQESKRRREYACTHSRAVQTRGLKSVLQKDSRRTHLGGADIHARPQLPCPSPPALSTLTGEMERLQSSLHTQPHCKHMVLLPREEQHAPKWTASYVPGPLRNTSLSVAFRCAREACFGSQRAAPL